MKLLLHACCAPCSGAILETLVKEGADVTVFYSNANIFPLEEYELRRDECRRYADSLGVKFVEDPWNHDAWLAAVKGLENQPERGSRCTECFRFRLKSTAEYASANGYDTIATTLASSRWKNLEQVDAAGEWACSLEDGVVFWAKNWRKGGLQERRNQIIKEQAFYNQTWCGCEFSHTLKDQQ